MWIVYGLLGTLLLPFVVVLVKYGTIMYEIAINDLLHLEKFYDRDGYMFVVAECCGGNVVGFVGVQKLSAESGELVHMHVRPSHRRCGLGVRLTQEVEKFCVAQSFKDIRLHTLERNMVSRALYEKCGFQYLETVTYPATGPLRALIERCYIKHLKD